MGATDGETNRLIEKKVGSLDGHKSLYSDSYYTREEFDELYGGETYKTVVKMTFAKGASLEDPSGLFNSSLDGNTRRAIDFHEGDEVDTEALKALVRAAVDLNTSKARR